MTYTIQEEYTLPSKGKLYNIPFDPTIKLRSMTVADEMKRLQVSDNPYKVMAEIIDDCLITKLPVSAYDMCMGDYQFLLHKLRVVTYGPEYKLKIRCPYCGEIFDNTLNLDELDVKYLETDISDDFIINLPKSGSVVELRLQTPRDLDWIAQRTKEIKKNFPDMEGSPVIALTLQTMIKSIDGKPLNPALAYDNLKQLPAADMNKIVQRATKLNEMVGIDTAIKAECPSCHGDVNTTFRFTNEFFGPETD